jgi:probable HAF family extracellular repeat protein
LVPLALGTIVLGGCSADNSCVLTATCPGNPSDFKKGDSGADGTLSEAGSGGGPGADGDTTSDAPSTLDFDAGDDADAVAAPEAGTNNDADAATRNPDVVDALDGRDASTTDSSLVDAGQPPAEGGKNPCVPNPCQYGGTCKVSGADYSCTCKFGYGGTNCEQHLFEVLGVLTGDTICQTRGISADGKVVVGLSTSNISPNSRAFRWTEFGKMQALSLPPKAQAFGASSNGSVIVGEAEPGAFRWAGTGDVTNLGTLAGDTFSWAYGTNYDGTVVVGESTKVSRSRAYRWSAGSGMTELFGAPGFTFDVVAQGTNQDGTVVIGNSRNNLSQSRATRWAAPDYTPEALELPAGETWTVAWALSADGTLVAGKSDTKACRWSASGAPTTLGMLPGATSAEAMAISGDGKVAVGATLVSGVSVATIWDSSDVPHAIPDTLQKAGVPLDGWDLNAALGVSADGKVVVGQGFLNSSEGQLGWIAWLP